MSIPFAATMIGLTLAAIALPSAAQTVKITPVG